MREGRRGEVKEGGRRKGRNEMRGRKEVCKTAKESVLAARGRGDRGGDPAGTFLGKEEKKRKRGEG